MVGDVGVEPTKASYEPQNFPVEQHCKTIPILPSSPLLPLGEYQPKGR